MKVLMINVVCGIRSTGRICTDLATALEALGHEVKIAYGRENVPEQYQKYAVKIGLDCDVIFHGIKARLFDGAGFGSRRATLKFISWIKEYDPDVIHLHNIHGYYINIEILFDYLKTCGKSIIWTLHDCWGFTGHTAYCDAISCERWALGCYRCPLKKEYPKSLLDCSKKNWERKKQLMSSIPNMTIVTPSIWLSECVKRSFLKEYHLEVINNGIDTEKFHKIKSDFAITNDISKKIVLGVATSWDEMKGLSDYYRLAELLGEGFQVVLVGISEKQKKHLPKDIVGITKTNDITELVSIYSDSYALAVLSKVENYPTVILEALCCDLPVVAYDVGGCREIIGENGGIATKGNVGEIAKLLRQLNVVVNFNNADKDKINTTHKYLKKVYNALL